MSNSVLITGGGTGGHLKVAKAIIDEYYKRGVRVYYIGSTSGQDKDWFESYDKIEKCFFLQTSGVVNKKGLSKLFSLFNILKALFKSLKIIKRYKIKNVISVGGFSAAPATFASILSFSTKLYIHEQNSVMGKLNKITSKYAAEVFSSFHDFSKIKDYPIDEEFFQKARLRQECKTIIFLGGSQGAMAINNFALEVSSELINKGYKIIHQTGKNDFKRVSEKYNELGLDVDVFDFSKELISKISQADFAVSRAGASTLWELCANNVPTLFVPYPYAASDHQYTNAKYLSDKNLAFLKREKELNKDELFKYLEMDLSSISKNLRDTISKDGVKKIVDFIEQ